LGFSNQERINLTTKVLAANVIDANETSSWYESRLANEFVLRPENILTQLGLVPAAATLSQAQTNAVLNPLIIQDASSFSAAFSGTYNPGVTALRLTPIPGANGSTFVAYQTYNNFSSNRLKNWIQPQKHPQPSGVASIGYTVRVFQGDPFSGGVEILTSQGQTGTGENASVAWIWNYDQGLLFVSNDFRSTLNDPYILAFRYIGETLNDSSLIVFNQPGNTFVVGDIVWNNAGNWQLVDPNNWEEAIRTVGKVTSVDVPLIDNFTLEFFGEYQNNILPLLPGSIGDPVYIDPANPGKLTNQKPVNNAVPLYIKLNSIGSEGLKVSRPIQAAKHNLTATVAPTALDDSSLNYQPGSQWIDNVTNIAYYCVDATIGAALWRELGSVIQTVDTAMATGATNESFPSFFSTTPLPGSVRCYFNGVLLDPLGYSVTGSSLSLIDGVNGYSTEAGDKIIAWYSSF